MSDKPTINADPARGVPKFGAAVTFAYLVLILVLNRLPPTGDVVQTVNSVPFGDKFGHLGEYGGLTFLLVTLCGVGRRGWAAIGLIAAVSGLAALDELTQPWWDRTCDIWDWTADTVAAVLAWGAAWVWLKITSRR